MGPLEAAKVSRETAQLQTSRSGKVLTLSVVRVASGGPVEIVLQTAKPGGGAGGEQKSAPNHLLATEPVRSQDKHLPCWSKLLLELDTRVNSPRKNNERAHGRDASRLRMGPEAQRIFAKWGLSSLSFSAPPPGRHSWQKRPRILGSLQT